MIQPVNGHLLIEPLKHETFIATQNDVYQEIGVVVSYAMPEKSLDNDRMNPGIPFNTVHIGDKVYFDSWMAAKFPKNETEYYWLVKWEDVRAFEPASE